MSAEVKIPDGCGLILERTIQSLVKQEKVKVEKYLRCDTEVCPLRQVLLGLSPVSGIVPNRGSIPQAYEIADQLATEKSQNLVKRRCIVLHPQKKEPSNKPKKPKVKLKSKSHNYDQVFDELEERLGYRPGEVRFPNSSTTPPLEGPRIRVVQGGAPGLGKRGSRGSGRKS